MNTLKSDLRTDFYERQHRKNLPGFIELGKRIQSGELKIINYAIDETEFGHRRVVIFLHDEEEKNGR